MIEVLRDSVDAIAPNTPSYAHHRDLRAPRVLDLGGGNLFDQGVDLASAKRGYCQYRLAAVCTVDGRRSAHKSLEPAREMSVGRKSAQVGNFG